MMNIYLWTNDRIYVWILINLTICLRRDDKYRQVHGIFEEEKYPKTPSFISVLSQNGGKHAEHVDENGDQNRPTDLVDSPDFFPHFDQLHYAHLKIRKIMSCFLSEKIRYVFLAHFQVAILSSQTFLRICHDFVDGQGQNKDQSVNQLGYWGEDQE